MGNRCCCWHDAFSNLLFHTTQSMLGISSLNWKTIFLAVTGGRRGKITDGCLAHRKTRLFGRRWLCCCWWWQKKIRRAKLGGLARRIRGKKLWPDVGGTCNQQYYYPVARRRHVVQVGDCCCCWFSCCCLLSVVSCVVECWCYCLLIILFKLISRELSIFLGETRPRIPVRMWKYRSNVRVVVVVGFHTGRAHGGLFYVRPTDFFRGLFCRN